MSTNTITCSFICPIYLIDKCNSFGGQTHYPDIVLQLMHEAKYITLTNDVTLLYIQYCDEGVLCVQQLLNV